MSANPESSSGALADPNAPAFKAFENPNPLAAPRVRPATNTSGSSNQNLRPPNSVQLSSSPKRGLVVDLTQDPEMSQPKMARHS